MSYSQPGLKLPWQRNAIWRGFSAERGLFWLGSSICPRQIEHLNQNRGQIENLCQKGALGAEILRQIEDLCHGPVQIEILNQNHGQIEHLNRNLAGPAG